MPACSQIACGFFTSWGRTLIGDSIDNIVIEVSAIIKVCYHIHITGKDTLAIFLHIGSIDIFLSHVLCHPHTCIIQIFSRIHESVIV